MTSKPYQDLSTRQKLKIKARNRHRRRFFEHVSIESYECPSCQRPFPSSDTRVWEVHHRDGDALNGHPTNLVALCHRCHKRTHAAVRIKAELDRWKASIEDLGTDANATDSGQAKLTDYIQEASA